MTKLHDAVSQCNENDIIDILESDLKMATIKNEYGVTAEQLAYSMKDTYIMEIFKEYGFTGQTAEYTDAGAQISGTQKLLSVFGNQSSAVTVNTEGEINEANMKIDPTSLGNFSIMGDNSKFGVAESKGKIFKINLNVGK